MKPVNSVDRGFQNPRNEVQETDVPKSGFNLTYRNHLGGLILGRLYPQSIQHLMPNDKISGSNEANLTFERFVTPVVDDVDVCVHNFLVTYRSIDKQWEKFMTPTKLNNMNVGVSVPTFRLDDIIGEVCAFISDLFKYDISGGDRKLSFNLTRPDVTYRYDSWKPLYCSDSLDDLFEQLVTFTHTGYSAVDTFDVDVPDDVVRLRNMFTCVFDFFIGKRSLFDYLGYLFISHEQMDVYYDYIFSSSYLSNYFNGNTTSLSWLLDESAVSTNSNFVFSLSSIGRTSYPKQNEYALRAYYAIWFEYYRNYDLEPRSNTLPEYHDFNSTSIFDNYQFEYLAYCVPRIRSWQQDMFTTAGIDDISRHVFAPVLSGGINMSDYKLDNSLQANAAFDNNVYMQHISWRDPSSGSVSTVDVPLPSRFISQLQVPGYSSSGTSLELFSLRKAQMLENFLKRIYYGGDEYRDRMLHLYGARIEDYRINRPQWLSSSLDMISPRQEVANTGIAADSTASGVTPIGTRVATATGVQGGSDGFTEFCPEFGCYISIMSIMPHATYDPYLLQNMHLSYSDFPIPQFANQMEDVISSIEISRQTPHTAFGYAPYAHSYRYRVDEVHGDYHDEKYDYCFLRFYNADNVPNLSWSFIHCRPKLPMFVNTVLLDGQVYGTFKHNFLVERPLPSPVEVI